MPVEVILPKVDMDMATGRIVKWLFAEGDFVNKGDVLFEIETDKAAMEIDAPASGTLRGVVAREGTEAPVGAAVAYICAEGETPPSADAALAVASAATAPPAARGARAPATPVARKRARELGVDLTGLRGSGPRGRIVRADVEALGLDERRADSDAAGAPERSSVAGDPALKYLVEGAYELTPHTKMRRAIAQRLSEAKRVVPHFYLTMDCNIDALVSLRGELNAAAPMNDGQPAFKLSLNDMAIKAFAVALQLVPDANVSWSEAGLIRHRHADIAIAVAVPGGLLTPILRRAELKALSTVSKEMKDLAARARAGALRPEERQGGSAAISNLGMFGVKEFSAILNPPHATILAIGAGERRPVVKDHGLDVATMMTVTLSIDHRALDGALGATLLQAFRATIERPLSMLV
jgi:pyruvate dehydrogenase E2 component (dihydrolipoamide acetyltransferase)